MISLNPNNKINLNQLDKFNNKLSIKLPEDYVIFLKEYNGGQPEDNIVKLDFDKSSSFIITTFFGIETEEDIDDIQWHMKILEDRIPKGYIPIAGTEGGDIICMNLNSEGWGYIYLWVHEEESIIRFAHSFNEFIEMINPHNPDDDDLGEYEIIDVWIDPEFLKEINEK